METQVRALGQWEVIDGIIMAPVPVDVNAPTPYESKALAARKLRAAHAYAEIALRVEEDLGDVFRVDDGPHNAWVMIKSSDSS